MKAYSTLLSTSSFVKQALRVLKLPTLYLQNDSHNVARIIDTRAGGHDVDRFTSYAASSLHAARPSILCAHEDYDETCM